jgi:beta-xylosidase
VNGPHQGAWVSLESGEDWFLHFQDRGAYGRIVHLQPLEWREDGWPIIGTVGAASAPGTPVAGGPMPRVANTITTASPSLQTTDEFSAGMLGLQWQWQANPMPAWGAVDSTAGQLRLFAQPLAAPARNLWDAPNLLMQKFPAEQFEATTQLSSSSANHGDRFGVVVFGLDYAWLGVQRTDSGWELVSARVRDADKGTPESLDELQRLEAAALRIRLRVSAGGIVRFAYSVADAPFVELPDTFTAREGKWVGAKFGVFASRNGAPVAKETPGLLKVNYVRVKPLQ